MSKRRRNRPSAPKQIEVVAGVAKGHRVNGASTKVQGATFTGLSRLACSGEILPPASLQEPSSAVPCEATQKSVVIEPMAPLGSLLEELAEPRARKAGPPREPAEGDSFPPLVSSEDEEPADLYPPSVIARRRRARKLVGVVIGAAALFFAFGVGKTALASRGTTVSGALTQSKAEVSRVHAMMGSSIDGLVRSMSDIVKQASITKPVVPEHAAVPATEPGAHAADVEKGAKLRKEAESLLNRGRFNDSLEVSQAAIAADPSHATAYLLLGTALQSTGKWKEGLAVYSQCVRTATRGPVHECSAVGGRK